MGTSSVNYLYAYLHDTTYANDTYIYALDIETWALSTISDRGLLIYIDWW